MRDISEVDALIRRKLYRETLKIENQRDSAPLKTQGLLCSGPQVTSSAIRKSVSVMEGNQSDPHGSVVELHHTPTNLSAWK